MPANANFVVVHLRIPGAPNYEGYSSPIVTVQRTSLTAPTNLKVGGVTNYTGQTAPLTWTKAVGTGGSGSVLYDILVNNGEAIGASNVSAVSYTIPKTFWGKNPLTCTIKIAARYSGLLTYSNAVTFNFKPLYTVAYHNGTAWVHCVPHYYNGTAWVPCAPYYYDGTKWVQCSSS